MENKNVMNDFLEGYTNIIAMEKKLDLSDKSKEIERLENLNNIEDQIVQNLVSEDSNDQKDFEEKSKPYMENIAKRQKEIDQIKETQKDNIEKKKQYEQARLNIRENAKNKYEELLKAEENRKDDQLKQSMEKIEENEQELLEKLENEKPANATDWTKINNVKQIQKDLEIVRQSKKEVTLKMNNQVNMSEKIKKDYILFLGNLSVIDKENGLKTAKKPERENNDIDKAYDEAMKENKLRNDWDEAIKEDKEHETEGVKKKIEQAEKSFQQDNFSARSKVDLKPDQYVDPTNINFKSKSQEQQPQSNNKEEKLKFEIGRKLRVRVGAVQYDFGKKFVKQSANMTFDEMISTIEKVTNKNFIEMDKELKSVLENMDPIIVNSVASMDDISDEKKTELLQRYMNEFINGMANIDLKEEKELNEDSHEKNVDIVYNKTDLSKANVLSRIFKRELNEEEKYKIISKADVTDRFDISRSEGEYKPNRIARLINKINRKDIKQLPSIDEIHSVAKVYNKLKDEGKESRANSSMFKNNLREAMTNEQLDELSHLHETQKAQELGINEYIKKKETDSER